MGDLEGLQRYIEAHDDDSIIVTGKGSGYNEIPKADRPMMSAVRVLADLTVGVHDGVMNDRGSIPAELYSLDANSLVGLTMSEARSQVEGVGGELWATSEEQAMGLALNPRRVWVITRGNRVIQAYGATPLPKDDRPARHRRGLDRWTGPPPPG